MDFKNQVDDVRIQEYLRTRLGVSAAVQQVGKDLDGMLNKQWAWHAAERDSLKQEIEELKIELLMQENNAYGSGKWS